MSETPAAEPRHFIRQVVTDDVNAGRQGGRVVTRFPPEPNGYLHIGHAKAICLDFGIAEEFGGRCHLRMDDTNPAQESMEYVNAIGEDIRWLGFDWGEHFHYAADYFEKMYVFAEELIRRGKAYVCAVPSEEFKAYRGVPTRPGRESPWRNRPADESLDLFRRMRAGEFSDGALCLRAKIDMASPNLHMRDPVLYRILRQSHYRTGDHWCLYPTYDFAHPLEDAFEGVTHSFCTLEFEVHRPLYDWVIEQRAPEIVPRQFEFARLNLTYTVMSKRKLLDLVRTGRVSGWDDPRMPTLCGLRRRGCPPEAIRAFCERIGITKYESLSDTALLEHCMRDVLNRTAQRRMAVLNPLKVILTNVPEDARETFEAVNNPEDPAVGTRPVPFGREIWIERDDFMVDPPKKFYRLAPGREVRLRYAGLITCTDVVMDSGTGEIREVHAELDPESRGGNAPDGRRVRGTLHWVSARDAVPIEARLYDRLFRVPEPDADPAVDFHEHLNPDSLRVVQGYAEPSVAALAPGARIQFERLGYFCVDAKDPKADRPALNRTVSLRDSWAKQKV